MKKTIYLHVGYHKTATTFLQNSIFPNLKKVKHIKNKKIKNELYRLRVRKLKDEDILEIRNRFDELGKEGKPTLISYEGLSGSPFKQKKPKKAATILKDLRRVFPEDQYDVKLIIGIREQVQMMTSLYVQHLHMGGYKQAEDYMDKLEKHEVLDQYKYNEYLDLVEEIFGQDYYLFIYENLKKDQKGYLLALLNYIGVKKIPDYDDYPANKSYGVLQAKIARRLNYFFYSKQNPNGRIKPKKTKRFGKLWPRPFLQNKISYKIHYKRYTLPEDIQRKIRERYKEDNIKLSQRDNVNLPDNYLY
ncbi:hypothetical protein [Aquisalibacillus elongatus]|uniref:Sulfotransferase domain-containing protein n=1 Tax=Aquisalibacillus elongatus TaxID=485577 RepID=A0A3N5BFY9_9BACI|nr:hypothetical protein [Aquisalibacillus elongatus]RPF54190.1 hypothetical protein EDC24_1383 [Aquisalibacillus elongatus]